MIETSYTPSVEEKEEFDKRLRQAKKKEEEVPVSVRGNDVIWYPQEGAQVTFLTCPLFEALNHGPRATGKSDVLLWTYGQYIGRGFGESWRGIIFRRTYPELADIVAKSEKWFHQVFPSAKFNKSKMMWEWPSGEVLLFRHMARPSDYWSYHGHELPFIGWEELTNWPNPQCYTSMISCCRTSKPHVPTIIRSTTNPYGVGHNWIKERFRLSGTWWKTIVITDSKDKSGNLEPPRTAIHSKLEENKILLKANPNYKQMISSSAINEAMAKAWGTGDWNIVAGGMFDDVWKPEFNVINQFPIPPNWRMDRSFDWGSSKPFSVGWWAESDGSDVYIPGKGWVATVRGDIFRFHEWYGWNGTPDQGVKMLAKDIAKGIIEREVQLGIYGRVKPGPADSSIYKAENGVSIGVDMGKPIKIDGKAYKGVTWTKADKSPGSRKTGWEILRKYMKCAHDIPGKLREEPGLFVMENCTQFQRVVPSAPRDQRDLDDLDTHSEDHIPDEVRYKVRSLGNRASSGSTTGGY